MLNHSVPNMKDLVQTMKRIMMTTAVGLLMAAPAMAQTTTEVPQTAQTAGGGMNDEMFLSGAQEGDIYGSDLLGKRLYASETQFDEGSSYAAEQRAEWDDVGEISDMLISQDGQIQAVLLDIGGFLGIGERTVAVQMDDLNFIRDQGSPNDMFVAISGTRETLESAPEYRRDDAMDASVTTEQTMAEGSELEADSEVTGLTTEPDTDMDDIATDEPVADVTGGALPPSRPAMVVDGYKDMEPEALTAEALEDAEVYSVNDEDIGEVSELVIDTDGRITQAVVNVGGFLGIGEKAVALTMDEIQIVRSDAGDDVRVYVDTTKEALEGRPEYVE